MSMEPYLAFSDTLWFTGGVASIEIDTWSWLQDCIWLSCCDPPTSSDSCFTPVLKQILILPILRVNKATKQNRPKLLVTKHTEVLWYLQIHWPQPKALFGESKGVLAPLLLLLLLLKLGRGIWARDTQTIQTVFERTGSTRPNLPCCHVGLINLGHNRKAFSHFQVPHFQSATYYCP